jgi:hypothetical protein
MAAFNVVTLISFRDSLKTSAAASSSRIQYQVPSDPTPPGGRDLDPAAVLVSASPRSPGDGDRAAAARICRAGEAEQSARD